MNRKSPKPGFERLTYSLSVMRARFRLHMWVTLAASMWNATLALLLLSLHAFLLAAAYGISSVGFGCLSYYCWKMSRWS